MGQTSNLKLTPGADSICPERARAPPDPEPRSLRSHGTQLLFCLVYKLPPLDLIWIQSCTPTTLVADPPPHGTNTKLQISLYLLSLSLFYFTSYSTLYSTSFILKII